MDKHNTKDGQAKIVASEKVTQLEQENLRLTNMLQSEFSNYKLIKKDNNKLRNLNKELLVINRVLADSNSAMREQLDASRRELGAKRNDKSRVLFELLEENPAAAGLDPESKLSKFLLEVKTRKPSLPKTIVNSSAILQSTRDRDKTRRQEVEGAKEFAHLIKQDISKLKIYQRLSKGKALSPNDRQRNSDNDPKAWSFIEDQEKQESNFDAKRDTLEASHILDGL